MLTLLPLDAFVPAPAQTMQVVGDPAAMPAVLVELGDVTAAAAGGPEPERIERFAFYAEASKAFAVLQTGERRLYGNILLRKGVLE